MLLTIVAKGPSAKYIRKFEGIVVGINDAIQLIDFPDYLVCCDHEPIERVVAKLDMSNVILVAPRYPHRNCDQKHERLSEKLKSKFKTCIEFQLNTQKKFLDDTLCTLEVYCSTQAAIEFMCKHFEIHEVHLYGVSHPPFSEVPEENPYSPLLEMPKYELGRNIYKIPQQKELYEIIKSSLEKYNVKYTFF